MRKKNFLLAAVIMVALLIGASALYSRLAEDIDRDNLAGTSTDTPDNTQQELPKEFPPDFTVMDASGKEVKLSDFRGKPTVVNFWASWCGPCKSEMPDFEELYQVYGDEITFMMVNMTDGGRETLKTAKRFVKESGYTFPVYYDTQLSAAMAYGVNSIPATYFIAADGSAVAYGLGALDVASIQRGIDMLLEADK